MKVALLSDFCDKVCEKVAKKYNATEFYNCCEMKDFFPAALFADIAVIDGGSLSDKADPHYQFLNRTKNALKLLLKPVQG